MRRPNLLAILNELLGAERALWLSFGHATVAATQGTLTPEARDRYMALRESLFAQESTVYDLIHALAEPIGLGDRVPAPQRLPEIAATLVATVGLGAAPAVPIALWVVAVIIVLAEIAALAYVVTTFAQIGADLITNIYQVHQNTARYELQLAEANRRYNACLRARRSPEECASANPLPSPPLEHVQPPGTYATEILALGGVVAGLGALVWVGYKNRGGKK
jgi:hypothetical protein